MISKQSRLVFVYFNLIRKCFSIRDVATGRVLDHKNELIIRYATFKVGQGGRERVLRTKHKNVHAGVKGFLMPYQEPVGDTVQITYNPYKHKTFVELGTDRPVLQSGKCHFKVVDGKPVVLGKAVEYGDQ